MHENILAAAVPHNEPEPFLSGVELHRAELLDGGLIRWRVRALGPRTQGRLLRRGAGVDAQDLRHLWPLRSWAGAHLKRRSRWHAAGATALDHARMEKGVAGAIRELHEAEPFVGIVPLDGSADGRTGGCFELWTARRGKSKIA